MLKAKDILRFETIKIFVLFIFIPVAAIASIGFFIIHLPGVPYNVRELFGSRNLPVSLVIFAVFLIWTTGGACFFSGFFVNRPTCWLIQPIFFLAIAIPSWLFLRYSVSAESLHDILGAPVLGWPSDWELFFRYLMLIAPFVSYVLFWKICLEAIKGKGVKSAGLHFMTGAGWLAFICAMNKLAVVDWGSTDNLRELITVHAGAMSYFYLYGVLGILTFNGVFTSVFEMTLVKWLVSFILTAVLAVVSWQLLCTGLTPEAVRFLLSPERTSKVIPVGLMIRWLILYFGIVFMTAFAMFCIEKVKNLILGANES